MVFERIKAFFRRGGVFTNSLSSPTDHPKIAVDQEEYARVQQNMLVYGCKYEPVSYYNAAGKLCSRPFVPLNVVKFCANWMATLIYNDKCQINIADEAAGAFIRDLFAKNSFSQNFPAYLEAMFATGGIAIRPYFAPASNTIKLSWAVADRFFPLNSNSGETSEGVMISRTRDVSGKRVLYYSLFEFHEWDGSLYVISNELYESDSVDKIGKKVPLGTLEKYSALSEQTVMVGLSRPQFVYLKPAGMNNLEPDSPMGLGMCDNARYTIDTINVLHDKFRRNIDRSRSGVVVDPEHIETRLENNVIRQVRDQDDIFLAVPGGIDSDPAREFSIPIQPEQYITSINFELRTFEAETGFSPGTFVFEPKGLKTAKEVVSEDSMTYQTRSKQAVVVGDGLRDLIHSALELAYACGIYRGVTNPAVSVDFDDGVFQDQDSKLDYYARAAAQKMMPRLMAIKRAFNLTDEDAQKWYDDIRAEEAAVLNEASRLRADLAFGAPGTGS